jgi:hypothetical protein
MIAILLKGIGKAGVLVFFFIVSSFLVLAWEGMMEYEGR